jgi:hypothetical protein
VVGLGTYFFAIFAFSIETPFPGEYALVPCIGAACLIYAGPQTVLGRMLSLRPVVFIGLISYSLYLWHWPLLVFARYFVLRDLFVWEKAAFILLSVIVAAISWAYVEKPFRTQGKIQSRFLIPMATAAIGIFVVASGAGEFSRGFPQRFDPPVRNLVETKERSPDRCDAPRTVGSHRLCRVVHKESSFQRLSCGVILTPDRYRPLSWTSCGMECLAATPPGAVGVLH